jgi:hypothetical protein
VHPGTPESIAVLTGEATLFAALFDLPLVAYSGFFVDALATSNPELQDELDAVLSDATDVERGTGLSFEALAAEPDLIYLFDNAGESIDDLPLYEEIAPTVMATDTAGHRERTLFAAEVLGITDEVAAQYDAVDTRARELGELLAAQGATPPMVSTIGFWDQSEPYVFSDGGNTGSARGRGTGLAAVVLAFTVASARRSKRRAAQRRNGPHRSPSDHKPACTKTRSRSSSNASANR